MLHSLLAQDVFDWPDYCVKLHVLANGCIDGTVGEAIRVTSESPKGVDAIVHNLADGGKSRTWNSFVHDISRSDAQILAFLDADITIPKAETLRLLCDFLCSSEHLAGTSSKPVKDITHDPSLRAGYLDILISGAGGTLNDWRTAICGQLYLLKADVARSFHMPIGLPSEDGFVRAMVLTQNFLEEGGPETRIDGRDDLFHVYASERSIGALIRHQTRLVIGSAINSIIYALLRSLEREARMKELEASAADREWLPQLLRSRLPRFPYGYVPTHFLFKRLQFWSRSQNRWTPKRILLTFLGFLFDAIVYVRAQFMMWRGKGAGFW